MQTMSCRAVPFRALQPNDPFGQFLYVSLSLDHPAPDGSFRPRNSAAKESDHKFCLFVLISSSFCAVCSVNPRRTRGLGNVLMRSRLEALKDEIHEVIFLEAYSGVANLRFVVIPLIAALAPCISLGCYFECIIATLFFSKLV
ncbi:hypothetical protein PVAP13_5NG522900 [Panicum virgatum]|uniref:Uncharacterized protein n=1 Tax=Panicum virgatum TaxID=38727 RepID=A0A8T0S1G7_PANVG|nr:hypothetical protein PVAP13_5NG522900 [Panicum virgatum]